MKILIPSGPLGHLRMPASKVRLGRQVCGSVGNRYREFQKLLLTSWKLEEHCFP